MKKPTRHHFVDAYFIKRGKSLWPADDEAGKLFDQCGDWPNGATIKIKIDVNIRQRALYHVLIDKLIENTDIFANREQAKIELKLACGEYDTYVRDDGRAFFIVHSMKVEDMPQPKFNRFFNRAIDIIVNKWLPLVKAEEIRREILDMIDGPEKASLGSRMEAMDAPDMEDER